MKRNKNEIKDINIEKIIREKNIKSILELFERYDKIQILSIFMIYFCRAAYTIINKNLEIKEFDYNDVFSIFAHSNDKKKLAESIIKYSDISQKINIKNIKRYSNIDIKLVTINFIKTIYWGNLEFSLRYGKELFLRDNSIFFEIMKKFAQKDMKNSKKEELINDFYILVKEFGIKNISDEILFFVINYMTKRRNNF